MNAERILSVAAMMLAALCLSAQGKHSMTFQGQEREYQVYVPDNLAPEKAMVIMLHGHGGKADNYCPDLLAAADRYGFGVCFPQGLTEPAPKSKNAWNVGYPFQEGWEVDDCLFLQALADKLAEDFSLNRANFFLSGMSNGGEMCYLMAHKCPEAFAAIGSLAGLCLEWTYRSMRPAKPVPFLEIHGTADKTSLWEGDPDNRYGWGAYLSVPAAVGRMVSTNCCTHEVRDTLAVKRNLVVRHHYCGGTDGKDVWLYEIQGGTHSRGEKDLELGDELWAFFSRYLSR